MKPTSPDVNRLAKAEQGAQSAPARPAESMVAPCPLLERWAIEVRVEGTDGKGWSGVAVRLERSPDSVSSDVTGAAGMVRFDGLQTGSYKVTLPELDSAAWRPSEAEALAEDKARSSGDHTWSGPETPEARSNWAIEP